MDTGNVESYQTIFGPEGEMTPYRGLGFGTCHGVNSPKENRTTEIPGPSAEKIFVKGGKTCTNNMHPIGQRVAGYWDSST